MNVYRITYSIQGVATVIANSDEEARRILTSTPIQRELFDMDCQAIAAINGIAFVANNSRNPESDE